MSVKYIESELVANTLSTVSIFAIITIAVIIVNSQIMYALSPIRLDAAGRLSGIFVGALKGIIFSSIIFFTIDVYYFIFTLRAAIRTVVQNISYRFGLLIHIFILCFIQ